MGWVSSIFKPKASAVARDVLELGADQRIFTLGQPDDLGFITSAEKALAQPPGRFRDVKRLTPDQWRKLMREGGASKEAFTWQIEPALKSLADKGLTGDIPKSAFEEALARARGSLDLVDKKLLGEKQQAAQVARELNNSDAITRALGQNRTREANRLKAKQQEIEQSVEDDFSDYVAPGKSSNYTQHLLTLPESQGQGYKSHNWRTPNPVGHIRTTNRVTADGQKVLHVEELQSDLHQEGARYGYKGESNNFVGLDVVERAADIARSRYTAWFAENTSRIPGLPSAENGRVLTSAEVESIKDPTGRELARELLAADDRFDNELNAHHDAQQRGDKTPQPPRAPMENWEEPFIRYALNQAAQEGQDVVTFPTWGTLHRVLRNEGTKKFYDERLPKTLARVAKSLGVKVENLQLPTIDKAVKYRAQKTIDLNGRDAWAIEYRQPDFAKDEWDMVANAPAWVNTKAEADEYIKKLLAEQKAGRTVPAIRLTPEAKQQLAKGVVQYGLPAAGGAAMLSLMFPDDAEAQGSQIVRAGAEGARGAMPGGDPLPEPIQPPRGYKTQRPGGPSGDFPGIVAEGNIDLTTRPAVKNADGSVSTVLSTSFGTEKGEVLVPRVSDDGRILTEAEALDQYRRTGKYLGIFKTPEDANRYAEALHEAQGGMTAAADARLPRSIKRGQWIDPGPGVAFRLTPEARTEMETARDKAETATGPELMSTLAASFRRESPVVSMFVDQRINDREGRAAIARGEAKAFNPFEGDYLADYAAVADRFADVMTRREADALKRQIDREAADMRTIQLSGASGVAAQFAAGLVDPTIFLPIAPLRRGESMLRLAFKGAAAGAASTALSEAWLNSTQELRTSEENFMAVTGGTFFGGILGAGASAFLKEKPKLRTQIEDELTYKGDEDPQFAADRADRQAMGQGRFASAGAAATDKTTVEAEALADVFGLDKVSGAVGLNPIVRLAASDSAAAREVSNMLAENGMFLGRNSKGQASPLAVETAMAEYRGWEAKAVTAGREAYKAHRKAGGSMTRTEFYDAVGRAMRRADEHPDPHVKAAAAGYREAVEKTKDRAIEMGLLPEDIAPETAASYFHRLWNRKAMTSKPEAFQAMAADWLEETFSRMKQRAFELENELVTEQTAQAAAKQGRTEASKALTEARRAVKVREARLEAAKRLEAGANRRSIDAAVEWRQVKSGMKPPPAPEPGKPAQEWDATFDAENVARLQKLEKDQEAYNRAAYRARLRIEQLQEELGWHRPILEKAQKDFDAAKRDHEGVKGASKLSDEDRKFVDEVRELMELERVEGSLKGVAANIAKDVYRRLIGYDQRTLPPRITIMERGPLANRTFHIPDLYQGKRPGLEASVEDFLVDDVEAVMSRYMRVMSADIELTRAFGDPTMKKAFDDINADYDELLAQAEQDLVKVQRLSVERRKGETDDAYDMRIQKETERVAAEQAKLDQKWADNPEALTKAIEKAKREIEVRRKKDLKDIAGVRDILRGNYGSPTKHDDLFVRGGAFIRNWNYVTLLGGMTVSAFPDVANKVLSNGFLGIARDLVKPLITDLKGIKIASAEARNYGIAIEGALNARIASMADIGDAYGRNTPFERSVSNVTNFFSTWTGMRLWNDVMKTADYVIAQNRAIRTLMNPNPSKRDIRWLAWAGVGHKSDLAAAMRKEIEAFGDVERGMRLANLDAWEDQAAARAFKGIMAKEASTVTVTPGAGDKLLALHGELGKTIGQFKTFAFAAHQRVTLRALQQARAGDGAYGSFFMTSVTMGMLVYWLKMADSLRETSDDPATWVREGIDRSGMLPLLFEVYNTTEKVLQVNDKHWAKPFFPGAAASRYNSRGPIASLLGPTAGRLEDVAGVLSGFADGNIKDSDVHALRKLLPFQNLIGIRRLLDMLEIEIDKNPAIKRTAFSKGREKALAQ